MGNEHLRVPNDFLPWPAGWPVYHNACNEQCDMAIGPCACSAWHQSGEFEMKDGVLLRYGKPVASVR